MLKPQQIDKLPEALIELYSQVEMDIIADMARRISGMDYFIPAAQWQYRKLIEMGKLPWLDYAGAVCADRKEPQGGRADDGRGRCKSDPAGRGHIQAGGLIPA